MIPAQIQRFASVGVLATLAHLMVALAAKDLWGLTGQQANIAGFCAAFGLSYSGHALFTFKVSGHHAVHMQRFLLMSLAGLLLSASLTYLIHDLGDGPFWAAMAVVGVTVPAFTYLSAKLWAFAEITRSHRLPGRLMALVFGLGYYALLQGRLINHDTSWYLVATRKWLEGARLYVDLVEVNPPLNFYYTAPAIWLAEAFDLSDIQGQILLTSGLVTASLLWVWQLLERAEPLSPARRLAIWAGAAAAMTVPFLHDYSQREHLLAITLMPWLIALSLSDRLWREEAMLAAFAGIGLCLKPHFMLVPITVTLLRMTQARSARPALSASNLVLLVMGLGYVAAVKLLHPEYLDVIVPMAAQVYGAYGFSAAQVIQTAAPSVLLGFVLLVLLARAVPGLSVLCAASAALVVIYAVQWTGYAYQIAPAFAVIIFACVWALARGPLSRPAQLLAVLCLGLMGWNASQTGLYRSAATALFTPVLEDAGPAPSLATFSSSLWPSFPLALATNADWTSRYPALWLIPGALNRLQSPACAAGCPQVAAILDQTRHDIVTDFVTGQPDVLIVDQNPFYIADPAFSYVQFLSQDPRFAPAFAQYSSRQSSHGFVLYTRGGGSGVEK